MKKLLVLFVCICLIFSFSGCSSNTTSLLTEDVKKTIYNTNYSADIRLEAVSLSQFSSTNQGFRIVGNQKDKEEADYLVNKFKEIGLSNVEKVPVNMDGWELGEISFKFACDCAEIGYQNFHSIGVYPSNFSFENSNFDTLNIGSLISNPNVDATNKGVILSSDKNLKEEVELAKEKCAAFVVYPYISELYSTSYTIDITKGIPTDIPVFAFSKSNYDLLLDEVALNENIVVTLSGYSKLKENTTSDFIIGEIEGTKKNEYIYVTANRDSFLESFFGSKVPVGELICLAKTLVNENYKPKYTIRFMITTGQEWGSINRYEYNVGIDNYLKTIDADKVKYCLVLDGSKPFENSVLTEYQVSSSNKKLKGQLTDLNEKIKEEDIGFMTLINDISDSYKTEGLVWDKYGVNTIIQAEPMSSSYYLIENTNADSTVLLLNKDMCKYLMYYNYTILKQLNK